MSTPTSTTETPTVEQIARVAMMDAETSNHPIHPWVSGSMMTGNGLHVVSAHCWICTGTDRPAIDTTSVTDEQTATALRALVRQNRDRFPGRVRSIVSSRLPRDEMMVQLGEALRNHRECVARIATEPPFAAWVAGGCVTR